MTADTRRRDLMLALLALLAAGLFALNTAGHAGDGAFAAAVVAMILPLLFKVEGPASVVRPEAPAGRSLPWRIALLLCCASMLWQVVTGRAGSQRLVVGLLLSVGSAVQAIAFFQRAIGTPRSRIGPDLLRAP